MMIITQQRLVSGFVSPHVKLSYRKTDPSYNCTGGKEGRGSTSGETVRKSAKCSNYFGRDCSTSHKCSKISKSKTEMPMARNIQATRTNFQRRSTGVEMAVGHRKCLTQMLKPSVIMKQKF